MLHALPNKEFLCISIFVVASLKIGVFLWNLTVMRYIIISSTFCYSLLFIFRKNCMAFMTILTLFFFFLFKKILISFTSVLVLFVFFFFRKILMFFTNLFSRFFWYFLAVIFLYVKKILQWFFMHSKPVKIAWNHFSHLKQQPS